MVKISAGFFLPFLTSEKEKPISVKEFLIDSDSTTNEEFFEFLRNNPVWKKGSAKSSFVDDMYLINFEEERIKYPKYSVVNISWFAARAYCNWKGKRLPTTSEWERIAQSELSGESKRWVLKKILDWYSEPTGTAVSKSFKSYTDQYGVRNLFGNIWEWVEDFNSFSSGSFSDREGAARGSFCATGAATVKDKTDYASFMRYAYRNSLKAKYSASNLGFRCAKNIES
ncbi:sulfatase-modifying factor enzyme 1 [Leptospira fainei serovar Hurstbridge str. BUT 6]|uniref:Sulfatase-modifying factor enzyme 1 n=1 Tax=Leptospira fainei serovar Hurstbridge str. BUT 6 TaxID=1193011 RepID=S3V468_9LEPT|nr:formylglycine-generating enzyme family protein [Leptospira fainei]EPG76228.1 sulfatase-modifying factor enzyme 1 [Leptospira fainei serovar Hurstbridge str. BUT 6]